MCSTWLWCYFLNSRKDAAVGVMPSTKTSSKTECSKICQCRLNLHPNSRKEQTVASRQIGGVWTFRSFEFDLSHAEQSFAHISPICYPATLQCLNCLYSCIIHLCQVYERFLNTYKAGSSFLFLGIAFCDNRLLYSKPSTPSFYNLTFGRGFHKICTLGSQWF